jgi:uncharacterized protein YoxC
MIGTPAVDPLLAVSQSRDLSQAVSNYFSLIGKTSSQATHLFRQDRTKTCQALSQGARMRIIRHWAYKIGNPG